VGSAIAWDCGARHFLQMTKGPAKPGLLNAARLLLLRRLVFAWLSTLLRILLARLLILLARLLILLARLLILLARLLVLTRLLVLLRIICSNRDIGHRIISQNSVRKYFQADS
jgi:hypothetical protein